MILECNKANYHCQKWRKSLFLVVTLLFLFHSLNGDIVQDNDADDNNPSMKRRMINFASYQAGAVVIDKFPANGKGFNSLLNDDRDKYAICPTSERKWMVIGLSEEVAITSVAIANYEKYSSTVREFQLLGSLKYPTNEWNDLGTYTAQLMLGEQNFNITNYEASHTRYLKIRIISHYLDEELFTLSQIKVYGQTVFVSLQEEVARSDETSIKLLLQDVRNDLLQEDLVLGNESGDATMSSLSSEDIGTPISIAEEGACKGIDDSDDKQQENGINGQRSHSVDGRECSTEPEQIGSQQQQQDFVVSSESILETNNSIIDEENILSSLNGDVLQKQNNDVNMEGLLHIQYEPITFQSSSDQHFGNAVSEENSKMLHDEETQVDEDKEEDENVTVEHETSGQVERLSFNRTEWNIVTGALQRSNLTVDFLKSTIQSIKQFFVDPLSQKMDMHNLERFISTQILPASPQGSVTSETEDTATDSSSSDQELTFNNLDNAELLVKESIETVEYVSQFDNQLNASSNVNSIGKDAQDNINSSSLSQGDIEKQENLSSDRENKSLLTEDMENLESVAEPPLLMFTATTNVFVETYLNETISISISDSEETAVNELNDVTRTKEEIIVIDDNENASDLGASSSSLPLSTNGNSATTGSFLRNSEANITLSVDEQTVASTSVSVSEQAVRDSAQISSNVQASNSTIYSPTTNVSHTPAASTPLTTVSKPHYSSWSSCLDQLKFSDFQARMMAKLQNKNASSDTMSGGNNNTSTAQNDLAHSSNNNNIFKQIIQRMKNLEANQAISDIYLSQLSDCLRIVRDEMLERQQQQEEFNLLSQQNPLSALFTLPLTNMHNQNRSSNSGAVGSSLSNTAIHSIPLLTSFTKGNKPLEVFWAQMFQFLRALICIMWRFVWIVVLSGRQEQGLLLTNTLQELRTLLQTSVVEFWCALVCGLVVSLLFGLLVIISIFMWMLLWCCCGGGSRLHQKEKELSLDKLRYVQREG